jgi:hypothetical protein
MVVKSRALKLLTENDVLDAADVNKTVRGNIFLVRLNNEKRLLTDEPTSD